MLLASYLDSDSLALLLNAFEGLECLLYCPGRNLCSQWKENLTLTRRTIANYTAMRSTARHFFESHCTVLHRAWTENVKGRVAHLFILLDVCVLDVCVIGWLVCLFFVMCLFLFHTSFGVQFFFASKVRQSMIWLCRCGSVWLGSANWPAASDPLACTKAHTCATVFPDIDTLFYITPAHTTLHNHSLTHPHTPKTYRSMNGTDVDGRPISVEIAKPREREYARQAHSPHARTQIPSQR